MSGRRGLTAADVVDAAFDLVASDGVDALTLSRVARELDVKPPSLYNHIDNLETLRRGVVLRIGAQIGDRLGAAAMGRTGKDALHAVADEMRLFAREHPNLHETVARLRIDDEAFAIETMQAVEPLLAILRGYALTGDEAIHAARLLRSSLEGFVAIEAAGGFGLAVDTDASFTWMIDALSETLERRT